MNKIIEKDDASVVFSLKENISKDEKANILNIINDYYIRDDCDYIIKINDNEYKGDMACICVFACDVGLLLKNKNYINCVDSIYAKDPKTNEISNILEFVKYER